MRSRLIFEERASFREHVSMRATRQNNKIGHLDALVTSGILKFRGHCKSKTTCKPDTSNDSQRVVAERLQRRQRRPDDAVAQII